MATSMPMTASHTEDNSFPQAPWQVPRFGNDDYAAGTCEGFEGDDDDEYEIVVEADVCPVTGGSPCRCATKRKLALACSCAAVLAAGFAVYAYRR